jgi:hypothetical protein
MQALDTAEPQRTTRALAAAGERVEVAALRTREGAIYSLPRPARHHDVIGDMRRQGVSSDTVCASEQGFLSTGGTWLRRPPAMRLAELAGQVKPGETIHKRDLFSEDLW